MEAHCCRCYKGWPACIYCKQLLLPDKMGLTNTDGIPRIFLSALPVFAQFVCVDQTLLERMLGNSEWWIVKRSIAVPTLSSLSAMFSPHQRRCCACNLFLMKACYVLVATLRFVSLALKVFLCGCVLRQLDPPPFDVVGFDDVDSSVECLTLRCFGPCEN